MEFMTFVFGNFWHWLGILILVAVVVSPFHSRKR